MPDRVFKIGVLLLGAALLLVQAMNAGNGRYQFHQGGDTIVVLDSKTGVVASLTPAPPGGGKSYIALFDFRSGKVEKVALSAGEGQATGQP